MSAPLKTKCAWCQPSPEEDDTPTTHGICLDCLQGYMAEMDEAEALLRGDIPFDGKVLYHTEALSEWEEYGVTR